MHGPLYTVSLLSVLMIITVVVLAGHMTLMLLVAFIRPSSPAHHFSLILLMT
jgi:hypothetical protein